ncbi:hypothetical protein PRIPAC_71579 [Pristionchus pacificus]|uniref:Uncharacterized protein n=1 Tax=Pristionchus pacificus TaxID=54126 RepID=A0A2A6C7B9_PRIPA|nr:hypothetical protein PRIPAC_71579 [Pristionchus pacificus]|eukprot:PDM74102.1 hypothetical protein PRIPAC_41458 [Pristionchus pacificus]
MNLARIHLFQWSMLECEQRLRMTWIAWVLVYLLTINPIVNPLITSLIYAPYRMTIKRFLVNIPVGNRPLYQYGGASESAASLRRIRQRRGSSGGEHEMTSLRNTESVRVSISTELSRSDLPSTPTTPIKRNPDDRRCSSEEHARPKSSIYPSHGSVGSLNGNL